MKNRPELKRPRLPLVPPFDADQILADDLAVRDLVGHAVNGVPPLLRIGERAQAEKLVRCVCGECGSFVAEVERWRSMERPARSELVLRYQVHADGDAPGLMSFHEAVVRADRFWATHCSVHGALRLDAALLLEDARAALVEWQLRGALQATRRRVLP